VDADDEKVEEVVFPVVERARDKLLDPGNHITAMKTALEGSRDLSAHGAGGLAAGPEDKA
jgi:hypothetical protein